MNTIRRKIKRMIERLLRRNAKAIHEIYFASFVPEMPNLQKTLDKALGVYYPYPKDVVLNVQKCLDIAFELNVESETQIAETISHEWIHHVISRDVSFEASHSFDKGHVSYYNMWAIYNNKSIAKNLAYWIAKDEKKSIENAIMIQICERMASEIRRR